MQADDHSQHYYCSAGNFQDFDRCGKKTVKNGSENS